MGGALFWVVGGSVGISEDEWRLVHYLIMSILYRI